MAKKAQTTEAANGEAAFDNKTRLGELFAAHVHDHIKDVAVEYDGVNGKATFPVMDIPFVSGVSLMQRGLAHLASNVVSSGVVSKIRAELGGKEITTAQITAFRAANGDKIKEWTAAEFGEAMESVRNGTLDVRRGGRRPNDPVGALAWELAFVEAEAHYRAHAEANPAYRYTKADAEEGADELMAHEPTAQRLRAEAEAQLAKAANQRSETAAILGRIKPAPETVSPGK